MTIIPALGRLRQEDQQCQVSLGYIVRPCLQTKTETEKPNQSKPNQTSCWAQWLTHEILAIGEGKIWKTVA
jgi:hypothetical protein